MTILFHPFEEAEKLSLENGEWVVGIVETHIFWPPKKQAVRFDGKVLVLLPFEQHEGAPAPTLPAIAIKADAYGLTRQDARKEIMRFASALSWLEGTKVEIVMWSGGNLPRSMGILRSNGRVHYLDTEHLPSPSSEASRAALAFYREGVSLDNPFYSFLSLYKAFSVAVPDKRERGNWMDTKCSMLDHDKAKERLAEIEGAGRKVGTYLYEQCRHAIAHADREPFVNPDSTDDHFRLANDLPLMRNFAELAIEEAFGVKRQRTIYHEHLYELEGFCQILPPDISNLLKQDEALPEYSELKLPDRYLVIGRRGPEQCALEDMTIVAAHPVMGGIVLDFVSAVGVAQFRVMLDFKEERLRFDPIHGFRIIQTRANEAQIREEQAALRLQRCCLFNGRLEIWDADTEQRLGCSEEYMPLNCFVNTEFFTAEIEALEKMLVAHQDKGEPTTNRD